MEFDRADIYVISSPASEFWLGEILSGVVEYQWSGAEDGVVIVEHPLAIILSADCDLTQDHKARMDGAAAKHKLLQNVLLCDVSEALTLKGTNEINSKTWSQVRDNKSERYHYLAEVPSSKDLNGKGFGILGIDFRNYFCTSTAHLWQQVESDAKRHCRLACPFAQHLAQRFFNYQARVGLPVEHHVSQESPPTQPLLGPPRPPDLEG